jgi:antitoxin CcdA
MDLVFADAPKKATNLTLNAKVLELACELGMTVSQTVDALRADAVRDRYREKWRADNRETIAAYNARVERDGAFGDDARDI